MVRIWPRHRLAVAFLLVAIAAAILLGGLYLNGEAQRRPVTKAPPPLPELADINRLFVGVAKSAKPAVVNISTTIIIRERRSRSPFFSDPFFRQFFGEEFSRQFQAPRERKLRSLGSGVIVTQDGYIITNNHVVEKASQINVLLGDGREFTAKLVGRDPKTDLAVIRIKAKGLPTTPWADSDKLQVGEWVLAIGNPFGLNQTVTTGIISAVGRANVGIADYEDFIQTDAPINPGNSGGALVNLQGELVGINTAIFSRSGGYMGIGFAIPSNMAKVVMESLIKTGKVVRGQIGLEAQSITSELAKQFKLDNTKGGLVAGVMKGGPADKAGIKEGDVIIEFGGKPVLNASHLRNSVAQTKPGAKVRLKLMRNGKEQSLTVTIDELPEKSVVASGSALAGLEVADIDARARRQWRIPRSVNGVIVTQIAQGSPAEEAGMRAGDIIQEINRQPLKNLSDYQKLAGAIDRTSEVLLLVNRRGRRGYVVVPPAQARR